MAAAAALPDDIVQEILLRLPPDDPACLLRSSLVCKSWGVAFSSPGFRRRLHELHRTPPVLGFLHNWIDAKTPRFIPTTANSSFSLAAPDLRSWSAIDCRHGRALFRSRGKATRELLVWEPITGAHLLVPMPTAIECGHPAAAVLCAADGCDHRDCHGGPFNLVFFFYTWVREDHGKSASETGTWIELTTDHDCEDHVKSACVYSSETGTWSELTTDHDYLFCFSSCYSSLLIGRSLYFVSFDEMIQEYDLATHSITGFDTPDCLKSKLMLTADGGLGVIQCFDTRLKLWSREVSDGTHAAGWLLSRVICLENFLPDVRGSIDVLCFAEGANVICVATVGGLFTIELQSLRIRKVCDERDFYGLCPVVSFYTPHSRLPPPPPSHIEEVGRNEEEKTLEQTQELFEKCKAVEKGNSANSSDCFNNHTLQTRVPCHAELPLDDPSGISMNAANEESVKNTSTTSKDDPGTSEASGGLHGDSEEGFGRLKK